MFHAMYDIKQFSNYMQRMPSLHIVGENITWTPTPEILK